MSRPRWTKLAHTDLPLILYLLHTGLVVLFFIFRVSWFLGLVHFARISPLPFVQTQFLSRKDIVPKVTRRFIIIYAGVTSLDFTQRLRHTKHELFASKVESIFITQFSALSM